MTPFAATVRYRFNEGDGSRDATFHGLFFDRSEEAVLHRLREAHRFAARIEVVEVRWRGGGGAAAREGRQGSRQYFVPAGDKRGCAPVHARGGRRRRAGTEPEATARGAGGWQPRRHARCRMFKPAHVVLDDAVLDCVLLDLSPGGAQVCLLARAELPDRATLWLPGGGSRPMRRRWQRGSRIGFEAVGDAVPPS